MKKSRIILAFVLLCMLLPFSGYAGSIEWKAYEEGMSEVRASEKKALLHFWTDWCTYCKKMDATTFADASVIEYLNEHYVAIKIDGDRQQTLTSDYQVKGFPTNWFLTEETEKITHLPGYIDPQRFLLILKYIDTDDYLKMPFQDFVQSQ